MLVTFGGSSLEKKGFIFFWRKKQLAEKAVKNPETWRYV
jgi:hypothetical protein